MSYIKKPILVPDNVKVFIDNGHITIIGSLGKIKRKINSFVKLYYDTNSIYIKYNVKKKKHLSIIGTFRSNLNNFILGVSVGFRKHLQLIGIGYKVVLRLSFLELSLGFSHLINYKIPKDILITCPSNNDIIISGIDKQLVGQTAAYIRNYKPVEPYKGKGIRYLGEKIRIKESKKK
ncbi:MAG: 50S ribosomal protein L6 [Enterobacteriaceae bacterium]